MTDSPDSACSHELPALEADAMLLGKDIYIPAPQPPKRHKCTVERFWGFLAAPAAEGARFQCSKCGQKWLCSNAIFDPDTGAIRRVFAEGAVSWQRVPR